MADNLSDIMGYASPFGTNSIFSHDFDQQQQYDRYMQDILSLMHRKGITEFYYTHLPKYQVNIGVVFYGYVKYGKLNISIVQTGYFLREGEFHIYEIIRSKTGFSVESNSGGNLIIKGNNTAWKRIITGENFESLPFMGEFYADRHSSVKTEELKQIYEEMLSKNDELALGDFINKIPELSKTIQKQLENPFYKNIQLCVYIKQLDPNGKIVGENTLKTSYQKGKECEVILNITVKPDNQVTIRHKLAANYLKEYIGRWEKEIKERDLDVNIEELRQQVIADFESLETEKNFYDRFIQSTEAFFNDKIGGYVEAVQATQKVAKHVWSDGTINESIWLKKNNEHKQWPEYMRINSYIGGVTDGTIDEIVGIPMALKGVYEIATDEEKQKALLGMFSKEGVKNIAEGLVKETKETLNDEDKSQHFVGVSTIAVISMITGFSLFSKSGKISDVLDKTTDGLKKLVSPKVVKVYDDIRNFFLKKPKQGGIEVNDYLKKLDDDALNDLGEELAEEADELTRLKVQPQKFIDGKKYEDNIKRLIDEGNPEYLNKVALQAGITVEELMSYTPLHQVQIRIPNTNGGFTTMDDVWVKKLKDPVTGKDYLEAIVNDCKLSKDSPFSKRQLEFENALDNSGSYFDLRNIKYEDKLKILQNTEMRVKSYMKTFGEGGSPPDLTKFTVQKIK